jgi:D-alanyl-D-alanine carboxypeptidase
MHNQNTGKVTSAAIAALTSMFMVLAPMQEAQAQSAVRDSFENARYGQDTALSSSLAAGIEHEALLALDTAFYAKAQMKVHEAPDLSRKVFDGVNPQRPYQAFGAYEVGGHKPLIEHNADLLLHMASLTKVITAAAYYYCWDLALQEAPDSVAAARIHDDFTSHEALIHRLLVFSHNHSAHKAAQFLERQPIEFIRQGAQERGFGADHYEIFCKIIAPRVLQEAGAPDVQIFNPSGLPPYAFSKYPEADRPINYKAFKPGKKADGKRLKPHDIYKDPEDYNTATVRDIRKIMDYVALHYPQVLRVMQIPSVPSFVAGRKEPFFNTNRIMEYAESPKAAPQYGVIGGKTGTTNGAGSCIAVLVKRPVEVGGVVEEKTYVVVVMGMTEERKNKLVPSPDLRDVQAVALIDSAQSLLREEMRQRAVRRSFRVAHTIERKPQPALPSPSLTLPNIPVGFSGDEQSMISDGEKLGKNSASKTALEKPGLLRLFRRREEGSALEGLSAQSFDYEL